MLKAMTGVAFSVLLLGSTPLFADDFPTPINTEKSKTTPMDPAEVVRTAKLPAGFQLQVAASEPQVQNPIAMTTDERGRLWVAENYSWAGGGAGGFDGNQRDRIVILEDTDGDGTLDKRTVFWDHARKLTSIEIGSGGVYAICLPNLLFIPDKNRDDVPDSEPVILLDGFDEGVVGHTPANGLKWGPDGWLYGRHGIQATSSVGLPGSGESQRFKINTGVWRYHPQRKTSEAIMHGMTNSWGMDYDQHGEMFVINTVIGHLWHMVPGAHTQRMYSVDLNPHVYQLVEQVADHVHWDSGEQWGDVRKGVSDKTSAAGGGHAHIGMMIYQGANWPEEYRNRVYTLNLHGLRINSDILARKGAGYTATHGPDLCFISDPWFRGMELLSGPDGGVYIADWSDTGECHDHDGVHRTSGRIYKLTYGHPKPTLQFDLTLASTDKLVDLLTGPNVWWSRQARRLLAERAFDKSFDAAGLQSLLSRKLAATTETVARLRLLEAIATTETGTDHSVWIAGLKAADEHERVACLRILVDKTCGPDRSPSFEVMQALLSVAQRDTSGLVQLYLASSLQWLPLADRWPLIMPLAAKPEFAGDRMLPLMLWYGIEPSVAGDAAKALSLVEHSAIPRLTECVSRRLAVEIDRDPTTVDKLLQLVLQNKTAAPESIIAGISQGLNGWQKVTPPPSWTAVAQRYSTSANAETRKNIANLNVVFGDGRAIQELRAFVTNGSLDGETRRQALRSLLTNPPEDFLPTVISLLGDRVLMRDAMRGLAQYDKPEIPAKILERLGSYDPATRVEMIQTLAARPPFAKALLEAVRQKRIAPGEISAFHARQIRSFENEELTKLLTDVWGDIRVSADEKRAQIESFKTTLTPEALKIANLSSGRAIFQKTCASCHVLYGVGRRVGPDLTGSNRKNIDYLAENIIDPSATVGTNFRALVVVLKDGRVLNGVVSEQSERTLTLQSAQEAITVDRNEIEEMQPTKVSLMPDGLLQNLTPDQIRDLTAYLMSTEQVPLPGQ